MVPVVAALMLVMRPRVCSDSLMMTRHQDRLAPGL
jgi:ribosomal protein S27AE